MLKVVVGPPDGYVEGEIASARKEGKRVVISSERGFDPLELARITKLNVLDPKFILSGVYVSRAFNVFQAERLMSELGPETAISMNAPLLVAIDLHMYLNWHGAPLQAMFDVSIA